MWAIEGALCAWSLEPDFLGLDSCSVTSGCVTWDKWLNLIAPLASYVKNGHHVNKIGLLWEVSEWN